MILIRIAAILGLGVLIQTALSANTAKNIEKVDTVVRFAKNHYQEFVDLCEQDYIKNGLENPKALLSHQQDTLFMQTFQAVNAHQAADLKDIEQHIKKFKKAAYKAQKLKDIEHSHYLQVLAKNLKRFHDFIRTRRGSYRRMRMVVKIQHMIEENNEILHNSENTSPAKTIALKHQSTKKSKYPIMQYIKTLDKDLGILYRMQKSSKIKENIRAYIEDINIQSQVFQHELIKTSDYAIERRMYDLDHPKKQHTGLKVIGGIVVAYFAALAVAILLTAIGVVAIK